MRPVRVVVALRWADARAEVDPLTGRVRTAVPAGIGAAEAAARGILLNQMVAGQPIAVATAGEVVLGGGLVPGYPYYLSDSAGGLKPIEDLAEGERIVQIGYAVDEETLMVSIVDTGATVPAAESSGG